MRRQRAANGWQLTSDAFIFCWNAVRRARHRQQGTRTPRQHLMGDDVQRRDLPFAARFGIARRLAEDQIRDTLDSVQDEIHRLRSGHAHQEGGEQVRIAAQVGQQLGDATSTSFVRLQTPSYPLTVRTHRVSDRGDVTRGESTWAASEYGSGLVLGRRLALVELGFVSLVLRRLVGGAVLGVTLGS